MRHGESISTSRRSRRPESSWVGRERATAVGWLFSLEARLLLGRFCRLILRVGRVRGDATDRDNAAGGAEALVVAVFDNRAQVHRLAHVAVAAVEVQIALGLGIGRKPVLPVDLLVIGGVGRREILVPLALVVGHALAIDEDDLEILLIEPDLALKVAVVLLDGFGRGGEDIGVEGVDLLPAEVLDVILRQVLRGQDEGQAVLDVGKVGGGTS